MKIVIVGDGRVGSTLAKQLAKEDHDVVVIDNDPEVLNELQETVDVYVIEGNGAVLDVQRRADVGNSDILIAATTNDELNIVCCMLARKLGCKATIARTQNRDYVRQMQYMSKELGLSMIVNPPLAAAREIFRIIQFPSFLKRNSVAKGRVELVELVISEDNILVEKPLFELTKLFKMDVLVCAVEREDEVYIPKGDFVLKAGDKISVTAPRSNLVKLIKKLNIYTQKIKNVMIVGGGQISINLADELLKSGVSVKIIEKDIEICKNISERLEDAIIINADGTNHDLLLQEGIKDADAFISLTDIDEENIFISMFATHLKVPKVITKMNRNEYSYLISDKGVGSIICPKQLTADEIIRYVRAMENTEDTVQTLISIIDDRAEAIEFVVGQNAKNLNRALMDVKLKKDVLIACISHLGQIVIPKGTDSFTEGDTVVVVAKNEAEIKEFNDIFM